MITQLRSHQSFHQNRFFQNQTNLRYKTHLLQPDFLRFPGAKAMKPIRQGDVILLPVDRPVEDATALSHLTLAEGEVTGHSHRIIQGQASLLEREGSMYLEVASPSATLSHEEHRPIEVPQGMWMVRIQREYEPEGWRHVQD